MNMIGDGMRKIKYILFVILLFLSFNVKADKCESKELSRLKELAKKVEFDYDYKIENGAAKFSINAVNLNEDLKVLIIEDYYNDKYKQFIGTTRGTLDGFNAGDKIVITIKGFVPNGCSGHTVLTKTIKLPYYNIYYDAEKCKGNEDFKYCQLLIDRNITESDFNKQYELYLENKEKVKEVEPEKTNTPTKDNTKLYIIIGGVALTVVVVTFVTMIIIKRRKRNML